VTPETGRSLPVDDRHVLVSDLHLGGGPEAAAAGPGFADPFDRDEAFTQFLAYLRRRDERRPYRLVLLGDTLDFLRVPVPGPRTGLYARDDAEAIGQLDRIHAAHPTVFGGLAGTLASGAGVDVVLGNHDVELARPAVRDRLRGLLSDDHGCPAEALRLLRFHPWGYHVPRVLYAEHGNHYHDINTFDRPLHPFRRGGLPERPAAARLGGLRRLASGRATRLRIRDALADLLPRRRLDSAAASAYRSRLPAYAAELGLAVQVVARLHELGGTSVLRILRRLLRARLAGGPTFREQLPEVAALVHEALDSSGQAVSFYVFGHTHAAQHVRLPGTDAYYLNTGTWSTDGTDSASASARRPELARCTWVEIDSGVDGPPTATLLRWAGVPVELTGPVDGAAGEREEMGRDGFGRTDARS
jgi:UDP-2,3-diacylglucosamine pyrophosphatase LpxH